MPLLLNLFLMMFLAAGTVPLTNADVQNLVAAGVSVDVIRAKMAASECIFDTSPAALFELKKNGVPNDILVAMMEAAGVLKPARAVPPPPPQRRERESFSLERIGLNPTPGSKQASVGGAPGGSTSLAEPVPAQMRRMLMAKKYSQLAETLQAKQETFEDSVTEEDALWEAFLSFSVKDPALAEPLNDWVTTSPGSWAARLARGFYLDRRAFTERGGASFDDTPPQRIAAMMHYLEMAELDFRAALSRNGKLIMAYAGLIGVGEYRGDRALVDEAYRSALRIAPASFLIRAAKLHSLKPRWGGSYAEMKAVAAEAQAHLGENPRLASLFGYVALDQADLATSSGDAETALQLLSQAISAGEDPAFLSARGWRHLRAQRHSEALIDFERAIALRPRGWWYADIRLAETLVHTTHCLNHLNKHAEALEAAERAVQIDPFAGDPFPIADWIPYLRTLVRGTKPQ